MAVGGLALELDRKKISMMDKLIALLSPPASRNFVGAAWKGLESKKGQRFPNDFKQLISIYGCGTIDGFILLLDPFSKNPNLNFEKSKYFLEAYAAMKRDFPMDYPRPGYPAKGSFFPWAVTDNGETFVWLVEGEPDSWKVAIHSSDQEKEEVHSFGCVELIWKLLSREVFSKNLPSQFPSGNGSNYFFESAN